VQVVPPFRHLAVHRRNSFKCRQMDFLPWKDGRDGSQDIKCSHL
jgi:hypothetical protein